MEAGRWRRDFQLREDVRRGQEQGSSWTRSCLSQWSPCRSCRFVSQSQSPPRISIAIGQLSPVAVRRETPAQQEIKGSLDCTMSRAAKFEKETRADGLAPISRDLSASLIP